MLLPLSRAGAAQDAEALHPAVLASARGGDIGLLRGKHAVVVEDEGVTQMQLRRILSRAGLRVVGSATSGEEAVRIVLREQPDLVLMDITMPGAINGLEATRRILREFSTCVVMVTAYSEHREEADSIGASGYVVKPVSSDTLLPEMERAWHQFHRR